MNPVNINEIKLHWIRRGHVLGLEYNSNEYKEEMCSFFAGVFAALDASGLMVPVSLAINMISNRFESVLTEEEYREKRIISSNPPVSREPTFEEVQATFKNE
jgi:hypothetical protein